MLAWELFFYHYIRLIIVAALVMAFLRVPGAHAPSFLGVCVCTYLVCHVGILVGAHRCLSHHACQFTDSGKALFAFLTSIAAQGPARSWAFLHRVHHRFCEQELDIHSPDPQDFGYGFFWAQGLFYTSEQMLAQMNTHNFHYVAPEMENEAAMIADGWPAEMVLPGQMIARHVRILVSFAILAFGYALRQATAPATCAAACRRARRARERHGRRGEGRRGRRHADGAQLLRRLLPQLRLLLQRRRPLLLAANGPRCRSRCSSTRRPHLGRRAV